MIWKSLQTLFRGVAPARAAEAILCALAVKERPVDIYSIASVLGVAVRNADVTDEGLLHFLEDKPVIFVRQDATNNRKRFTIAHELGHLFLHSSDNMRDVYFKDVSYSENNTMEQQANRFAANLLIPDLELIALVRNGHTKDQIANYFAVSRGVLDWQIADI